VCAVKELDPAHSEIRSGAGRLGGCVHIFTMWSVCWCVQLFDLFLLLKVVTKRYYFFRCYKLCSTTLAWAERVTSNDIVQTCV